MNTDNPDQEEAPGNLVTNFLVQVVLIRGRFAEMLCDTTHMTTTEFKSKKTTLFLERE